MKAFFDGDAGQARARRRENSDLGWTMHSFGRFGTAFGATRTTPCTQASSILGMTEQQPKPFLA
jgi:hypothetical protein